MVPEALVALAIIVVVVAVLLLVAGVAAAGRRSSASGGDANGGLAGGGQTNARSLGVPAAELVRLTDLVDLGLLRVDNRRTVVAANQSAHRFLGRAPGSLPGMSVIAAFLDHRIEGLLREADDHGSATIDLQLSGEPPRTLVVRAERADDDQGARWLIVQDASELRRLQRIRAEFVDNLSHELRTPLTTIRVLSETLSGEAERAPLPERVRDAIGKIDVETDHLAQMVTELLDLARIEQGERVMRRGPVDLGLVVEQALERLRPYADRQRVSLRSELPGATDERAVNGDADRLGQLLLNLLHNAIKFSPPDTEVVVRVRAQPADDRLLLEVEDQGPGIPSAELERIFERFHKVDRARTRAGAGGTGLGLAIARHIAQAHGGRIWAESEEGRGARFLVELPRTA